MLSASTPAESFCEVVSIVGMVFALSRKSLVPSPLCHVSCDTAVAFIADRLPVDKVSTIAAWSCFSKKTNVFSLGFISESISHAAALSFLTITFLLS